MHITILDRREPDFYSMLGPIFGSREYEKEVGIRAYDDEGKLWFCSIDYNSVVGVASLNGKVVSDCYVIPSRRHEGIFSDVLARLLQKTSGTLRATCTPASARAFLKAGFVPKSELKNYTKMEMHRA